MANVWRDLRGILGNILGFGKDGFNLKNASGVAQFRNNADSGWADVEVEDVLIHSSNSAFYAQLQAPAGLASNQTYILPLAGATIPTTTGLHFSKITSFTQATSSPLTLDAAPPANATLAKVRVMVDTAAAGGSPTITVGISGTPARDMAATENNLKAVGQYIVEPMLALGGSPGAQIGTIVVSAQTFIGRIELEYILA
jgi:hypothetical protein